MSRFAFVLFSAFAFVLGGLPAAVQAGCQQCVLGGQSEGKGTSGTFSGSTLGKGKSAAGFIYSYRNWDTIDSRAAHREQDRREREGEEHAHVHNKVYEAHYFLNAAHGVAETVDVGFLLPYVQIESRNTHDHDRLGQRERSTGIGDLVAYAKWLFWRQGVDASAIAALKFPTGETREKDGSGERFEPEEQPGSGSWDPILGMALTKALGIFVLDASLLYTIRTEGDQDYEFGNSLKLNGAVSVKILELLKGVVVYATLEANALFEDRDKQDGHTVKDTGASILFLTPGLRVQGGEDWVAYVSAPLPAVQNRPSGHQDLDYSILAGITFRI